MANLLTVQMFNSNTAASTNAISSKFKVFNTGGSSINLSDVTVRYYYTVDSENPQNFWCDYAALIPGGNTGITDKVTGTFEKITPPVTGAGYYLQIGFKNDAGTLAAGASAEVHVRFSKADWTNYNQVDDYSFNSSASGFADWNKVTAYVGTTQVWGIAPTGDTPGALELAIGSASVKAGESVTIPVTFKGVPVGYVDNCDFQVSYDNRIFETAAVAAGEITVNPAVNFAANADSVNGIIYMLYTDSKQDGTEAVKQDGVFAKITLTVKSTAAAGMTEIKVKSVGGFTDKDLNTIDVKAANGMVTI